MDNLPFASQYTLRRMLGKGTFGTVFECSKMVTSEKRVAKFIHNRRVDNKALCHDPLEKLPVEILMLRQLDHPNIIEFVEYFYDHNIWVIVMEYCPGYIDLHKHMKTTRTPFPEENAAIVIKQVVSACLYCRTLRIDHRDIKDNNILYNPESHHIKLIDFGSATLVEDHGYTKMLGAAFFTPPEFFFVGRYYADPSTVWAIGCLAFLLINGQVPYRTVEEVKDHPSLRWRVYITFPGFSFIMRCLELNSFERMPLHMLPHSEWLKNI